MNWPTKSHSTYMDLVVSWLRSEIATLNNVLDTIVKNDSYSDEYVRESMKEAEVALKQIRKFINAN
ncbi:MAG: hypothetical protein P9M07_07585 [Candidatus Aceula meridiana]|nr:hypothetical protein [Candidatus Aceula meridiana]